MARVLEVRAEGEDSARLKALGICVGRPIQLVQLGDPLIVRVIGTRIGLSARLATHVLMEPVDPTPPVNEANGTP